MSKIYVVCVLVLPVILLGCVTAGKKLSDKELIQQTIDQWGTGLIEKDLDKFLSTISESFSSSQASDKATLASFIEQAIDAGYIDDAQFSREDAQYTIEGSSCTVYPIDLSSSAGSVSVELKLTCENGQWLISGMEVDGL